MTILLYLAAAIAVGLLVLIVWLVWQIEHMDDDGDWWG